MLCYPRVSALATKERACAHRSGSDLMSCQRTYYLPFQWALALIAPLPFPFPLPSRLFSEVVNDEVSRVIYLDDNDRPSCLKIILNHPCFGFHERSSIGDINQNRCVISRSSREILIILFRGCNLQEFPERLEMLLTNLLTDESH